MERIIAGRFQTKHDADAVALQKEAARRFETSDLSPERRWENEGGLVLQETI